MFDKFKWISHFNKTLLNVAQRGIFKHGGLDIGLLNFR